jgi:hypothetical protein
MDVTARQLRTGLRSPRALARLLREAEEHPIPPDTPRSNQRRQIVAALRHYFASDRDPAKLLADYDKRTSESKRKVKPVTEIANGRRMLLNFVALDEDQPPPTKYLMPAVRVKLFRIGVTMSVDIAIESSDGWVLRQVITDQELVRPEQLRLYATAVAMHFEGRPDGGPVARVDLLLVRRAGRMVTWNRAFLRTSEPRLATRCEQIRSGGADVAA